MSETLLEAADVQKRFDESRVLDGVDLTVNRGDLVVVMGPNGAGKSVLLSCLAGSTVPESGRLRIHTDRTPTDTAARRRSSVMLQGRMVDPDLTGRQNVAFYRDLHPRFDDRWRDVADRLEIADALSRPVGDYSGGMERKLELTLAVSVDVPLYLLDEPTAELDLSAMQTVHELLAELRDDGRTIVLASHSPLDAEIADRIVFLSDGRVVAEGGPEELLSAVPEVVRPRDGLLSSALPDSRVFGDDTDQRGFLPDGTTIAEIAQRADSKTADDMESVPPTYTDMFNYYAHVRPSRETTGERQSR